MSCSCWAEAGADTEQSRPWPTMTVGWVERSETHHLPAITRRGVMGFASLYSSYEGRIQNSRSSHYVAAAARVPLRIPNTAIAIAPALQGIGRETCRERVGQYV